LNDDESPSVGFAQYRRRSHQRATKSSKRQANCCDLLRKSGDLNFYGNVEGNDIFKGTVDIVVCDGFVGNVALKASEGLASMIGGFSEGRVFPQIFSPKLAGNCSLFGANCL